MKLPWKLRKKADPRWEELKKKVDLGLELRRPFEAQWVLNLAFLAGKQYSFFNTAAHTLHDIAKQPGKIYAIDNIILPKWARQVSNFIKSRPKMFVVPNSDQEEDIEAARLGTKIFNNYYKKQLMKAKGREMANWIYSTGNAFLSDFWNPKAGPMGLNKEDGKISYAGDVGATVRGPFNLIVPTYLEAKQLNDMPWVIVQERKSVDWLRANIKGGKDIVEEDLPPNAMTVESLFSFSTGHQTLGKVPSANLYMAYVQPCEEFPKGKFIRGANGVIDEYADFPFDQYPIEHFKDIDVPRCFWGDATTTHAVPHQIRWNDCKSSIAEFNKEVAKVKMLTPRQSNIEVIPDANHREIINYKPVLGHKPEFLTPYTLGPSVEHEMEQIMISMENLYSQHEVSRGTNRSDIRSGDMVELLLEQDASGGIPAFSIFEEGMERHGTRYLQRVQAGYTSQRIAKIGNTEDEFEVIAFKGADLRNNNDVSVVTGSSLPDSPAARSMRIERKYQMGLLGNPSDPKTQRRVLRMQDDNIVDDVFSDWKRDEKVAQWENRTLLQGHSLHINPYDNHAIHDDEHDLIRKSVRFQRLKVEDPMQFERLDMAISVHQAEHKQILQEEMKKQIQLMQLQGGNANG